MSTLQLAQVFKQLPAQGGVLVVFRDASHSVETPTTFCRVLSKRAHPVYGASQDLPEEGELGVVAELAGGFLVWIGGLPYQDANQVDPTVGLAMDIHTSGVIRRTMANGDFETTHPSGLRFTVSQDGEALPDPLHSSKTNAPSVEAPHVNLVHPAGGELHLDPDGNLTMQGFKSFTFNLPGGGQLAVDDDGNLVLDGLESVKFQTGSNRFVMDTILAWLSSHTHGNGNNGASTAKPNEASGLTPAAMCSPAKFTGPQGA